MDEKIKVSVDLPVELRERIAAIADKEFRSFSGQIRLFLENSASQWDASRGELPREAEQQRI